MEEDGAVQDSVVMGDVHTGDVHHNTNVTNVDNSMAPPSYTIKFEDGGPERSTEADRLLESSK